MAFTATWIYLEIIMLGVPITVWWKQIQLGTMGLWVQSLALLSGLRIWRCRELWCGLQTQIRSRVAMALAQAGRYSSNQTPSLGTSIFHGSGSRKGKKTPPPKKERKRYLPIVFFFGSIFAWFWKQGDGGNIECLRECSFSLKLLKNFKEDEHRFLFVCVVGFSCNAICS